MISHLLNSFIIGSLFVEMLERRFPEQFHNFMISLSYNCIYYYGKLQILFIKHIATNPFYLKVINAIETKSKGNKSGLEFLFVKDNYHYNLPIDLPDLIITTDVSRKPTPKRVIYTGEDYRDTIFTESDIKFMLIEFAIGEKLYKLDLKTDEYNYYMIGNKFTKEFFIYYINKHLLSKFEQHDFDKNEKYYLKVIDHEVNTFLVYFTEKNECIELYKNSYKVNSTNNSD